MYIYLEDGSLSALAVALLLELLLVFFLFFLDGFHPLEVPVLLFGFLRRELERRLLWKRRCEEVPQDLSDLRLREGVVDGEEPRKP